MNSVEPGSGFAVVIGLDRSDCKVDLCQFETPSGEPVPATVNTSPEALRDYFHELRARCPARSGTGR
jgi:hypothetical protein